MTTTRHHRKPKVRGGKANSGNISRVPQAQHRAFHTLFQTMTVPEIASLLNSVWIDPSWELVPQRRQDNGRL